MTQPEAVGDAAMAPADSSHSRSSSRLDGLVNVFASGDHKVIGRLFVLTALVYVAIGAVVGSLVQFERGAAGITIFGDMFPQYFGAYFADITVTGVIPLFFGLALVIVPLQIGATRVAFPRLVALSYWLYLGGAVSYSSAHLLGGPDGAGYILSTALRANPQGATTETRLWMLGLATVSLACILASLTLVVTILTQRRPGMSMLNMPLFAWGSLAAATVTIVAGAAHLAGVSIFAVDQITGGVFFLADTVGTSQVWQHLLWLPSRPEVLVVGVPVLGALADFVSTSMKRPLVQHNAAAALLVVSASLTFLSWTTKSTMVGSIFVGTPTVAAALWLAPLGLVLLLCLATIRPTKAHKPAVSVQLLALPVVALIFAAGLVNAIVSGTTDVQGGSTWSGAHFFLLVIASPIVVGIGAAHYWAPKLFGRLFSSFLSTVSLLAVSGGVVVVAGAQYVLGYANGPWLSGDVPSNTGWLGMNDVASDATFKTWSLIAGLGFALLAAGVILMVLEILLAVSGIGKHAGSNPAGGVTLEWTTASPPVAHNFDSVPTVFGPAPLLADDAQSDTASSASDAKAELTGATR